jgi:5-methylcytosine-specific restriction protein A
MFYAPIDPKALKKEREKARELRKSNWWLQKLNEGVCYYCQNQFSKTDLTMDHKVPLARGGLSSRNNIVICCKDCNSKKQSKTSVDFTL